MTMKPGCEHTWEMIDITPCVMLEEAIRVIGILTLAMY